MAMKLKQQPDDFQVEELTDIVPTDYGPFSFYRLEKRGWATPDALAAVRRRWRIEPRRLSYGGLKDRHAATAQYLTIFHGPKRNLRHHDISVAYLGQIAHAYASADIRANRFVIRLRDLTFAEMETAQQALEEVRCDGVPNYFDDQRFGSVSPGGEFIARLMVLERFEDALRLALAAPYEFDRAEQKREKAILLQHWGDWAACKEHLPRGHARSLVDYLRQHPGDFRGALARLRPELRGLYLSAYQSHLWNRMLARWLSEHCRPEQLVPVRLRLGDMPMHRRLDAEQRTQLGALTLPLPSASLQLELDDPRARAVQSVLDEEALTLPQLRIKGVRELFFSKGERAALCLPADLAAHIEPATGKHARHDLTLAFELPRGAYATLLVKRICHPPQSTPSRKFSKQ
jgi:tRNA pseudouridine13 synthase